MRENVKLPETVEEYQRARREAFEAVASWGYNEIVLLTGEAEKAARLRYPIRKRVPRVVRVHTDVWAKVDGDVVRFFDDPHCNPAIDEVAVEYPLWAADLFDLLDRPTEEVER